MQLPSLVQTNSRMRTNKNALGNIHALHPCNASNYFVGSLDAVWCYIAYNGVFVGSLDAVWCYIAYNGVFVGSLDAVWCYIAYNGVIFFKYCSCMMAAAKEIVESINFVIIIVTCYLCPISCNLVGEYKIKQVTVIYAIKKIKLYLVVCLFEKTL